MSDSLIIVGMALVTYLPRLLGFALSSFKLPPFWLRFLRFVPITVFAALITPALLGNQGEGGVRIIAALLATLAIVRTKSLVLGLAVGMVSFWVLR